MHRLIGRLRTLLLAVLLVVSAASPSGAGVTVPPAEWLVEQVKALSAPAMDGRRAGTAGADRAARHVAAEFQRAGLAPGGDGGTYFQSFEVPTGVKLGQPNTLALLGASPRTLRVSHDFVPLAVSADGRVEAPVVFAGYGITAPDLGYDDYAGLDVRGAVVLVLGDAPGAADPASPFRRPDAYHYAERAHKVINGREHGARAVLLAPHPSLEDRLPALRGLSQSLDVVAAAVTRATADTLLRPAGRTLAGAAAAIDRARTPASFAVPGMVARLEVTLVREHGTATNVVAVLPGADPRVRHEAIVVAAHYDHLGRGGEGSLAPDAADRVHPGADDNASGTAAVMGLARAFAAAPAPRTLIFVAFGAEELGLLGSRHYARHAAHPLERTIMMANLDMVGRLRDGRLYVGGVDSGSGLRALVTAQAGGLDLKLRGDPYTPSDHTTFYQAGRPVLFFFTGAHADYHRPSDTWDKVDGAGLHTVTALVARLVGAVAAEAVPPTYARVEAAPSSGRRGGSGYGPFLGLVPEFGEDGGRGVKVGGVRAGSPAEKAGVRGGDLVVAFAGIEVRTLDDLVFALRRQRAGDRVEVVIRRDDGEHRLEAVLEERRQ